MGGRGDFRVVLGGRLADHRPDPQPAVDALDRLELGDPVEVDQALEAGETQRQHRHQALTAGEHLGVVAVAVEELDVVGERAGRLVRERCGFHDRRKVRPECPVTGA
jgi:hypothetical protein